ncbi:MAG TPA: efflux RND transporter periplasmic adaptor subunit [Anaerolineaceae bacterium]|nr:efflux RND transporter periplasmic adaptor subunit [Anaerolineaceae bacterium]
MKSKKRTLLIIGAVIVVIIAIVIITTLRARNQVSSTFETTPVTRGNLTAIVGATGAVHSRQSAILVWQTNGQVGDVRVKIDDTVNSGQVLADLLPSSVSQSIILAEADLISARQALEDLTTSNLASAAAYQNMVLAQDAVDDAREKLESKQYARASQETVDIARANLVIAEDAVTRAEEAYDKVDSLQEDNPIRAEAFSQLARARQNRDTAQANLNWLLGLPDSQEMASANANLDVALAKLEDATREWERVKDGPNPDDVKAAEARVAALEATLKLMVIEAPFNGTITDVQTAPGDLVSAGTKAFRIDDLSQMLVDVDIPEIDINRIKVGQPASITFDAIQNNSYEGEVTAVARVGSNGQGVVNFRVTVVLLNPDEMVHPGMTAALSIIINQLEDVLLIPNRAVRTVDNQRVVYVLQNNLPVAVPIEIGVSSDTFSELVGGDIQEGDLIVLNPPSAVMQNFGF